MCNRVEEKCEGGKIICVEVYLILEYLRLNRVKGRVALVGDVVGYVTKCSGEGIYFVVKLGCMVVEVVVE